MHRVAAYSFLGTTSLVEGHSHNDTSADKRETVCTARYHEEQVRKCYFVIYG